jgi:hypothetical protein
LVGIVLVLHGRSQEWLHALGSEHDASACLRNSRRYEDQNDHASLRSDPVFKLIAQRLPDYLDLASQPTISRLENAVTAADLLRMEEWFIDRFIESFAAAPSQLTLDVDLFDDPTHGDQPLTLLHGFYNQYQYLVRVITCAENDFFFAKAFCRVEATAVRADRPPHRRRA